MRFLFVSLVSILGDYFLISVCGCVVLWICVNHESMGTKVILKIQSENSSPCRKFSPILTVAFKIPPSQHCSAPHRKECSFPHSLLANPNAPILHSIKTSTNKTLFLFHRSLYVCYSADSVFTVYWSGTRRRTQRILPLPQIKYISQSIIEHYRFTWKTGVRGRKGGYYNAHHVAK